MGEVLTVQVTAAGIRRLRLPRIGPWPLAWDYAEHALPSGLVVPSDSQLNVQDEPAFARALAQAIGPRPPRWARLVLADRSIRLQVLGMDRVPPGGPDVRKFLLWRLGPLLPFSAREARLTHRMAPNGQPDRAVAIALVARDRVVAQYERLFQGVGITLSHVAPAACHLFNLFLPTAAPDALQVSAFLSLGRDAATLLLAQQGIPHYARTFAWPNRPLESATDAAEAPPPDPAGEALAAEVRRTVAHAEETAGLPAPTYLHLAGEGAPDAARQAAAPRGRGAVRGRAGPPLTHPSTRAHEFILARRRSRRRSACPVRFLR